MLSIHPQTKMQLKNELFSPHLNRKQPLPFSYCPASGTSCEVAAVLASGHSWPHRWLHFLSKKDEEIGIHVQKINPTKGRDTRAYVKYDKNAKSDSSLRLIDNLTESRITWGIGSQHACAGDRCMCWGQVPGMPARDYSD